MQGGFTLLEVLIAASIFASIMLIAVGSFTKMNQLNDRAREIRAVAEAGRFVMDALERSVSSANGADQRQDTTTTPATTIPAQQSLALCVGPTRIDQATANSAATKLVTATSDASGVTTVRSFYLDSTQNNQFVQVENKVTPGSPLTANDVTVSNLKFTGVSAVPGATAQPYVTIDFDVVAVPLRAGIGTISQHFRTSIVSRDYAVNNHGQGTLCSF